MTFIAGIRIGQNLILVADSAVSSGVDLIEDRYSYFEQLQKLDPGIVVDEAALKICALNDSEIVTFSGDAKVGYSIVNFLRENAKLDQRQRLEAAIISLGPFDRHVDLLLGAVVDKDIELLAWRSQGHRGIEALPDGAVCCFGSGREFLREPIQNLLRNWHGQPTENLMVILSAGIQASAQHQATIDKGVGGMIAAAALSQKGIEWLPDINFLTYGPDNFIGNGEHSTSLHVVSSFIRDGTMVLCTRSPALKSMLAIPINNSEPSPLRAKILSSMQVNNDDWWNKWELDIDTATNKLDGAYFVFLSRAEPRAVVVQSHNNKLDNRFLNAKVKNSLLVIEMNKDFLAYLRPDQQIGTVLRPAIVFLKR